MTIPDAHACMVATTGVVVLAERTCEANPEGENSSFIFTVCVKFVPLYHFKLAYVILVLPGDPKKYSCLIKRKMNNKKEIFKIKTVLNYQ